MKDTGTEPSGYVNTCRILSSISNEALPLNHSFQRNHQDIYSEIKQFTNNELEVIDVHYGHNMVYNILIPPFQIIDLLM